MSDPQRSTGVRIPDYVRITDEDLAPIQEDPYRLGLSPQEREDMRRTATESRTRLWLARVPSRFATASADDLTPEQNPGDRVRRWWAERDVLTLVLRSEQPGVGKTHAAYAVGNLAVADGAWATAWTMVTLNDAFRPGNDPTAYDVACECDLLVLDDLGRERVTEWTLERLQGLLDARWRNRKRTIITTNLDGPTFVSRYGDPIVDRVRDEAWTITVTGQTRRAPAPW
jgi:DNA replication protein DnaC